jgi:hypothetical protein
MRAGVHSPALGLSTLESCVRGDGGYDNVGSQGSKKSKMEITKL